MDVNHWLEVKAKLEAIKGQVEALEMFLSPFFNQPQGSASGIPPLASAAATVLADTAFVSFSPHDANVQAILEVRADAEFVAFTEYGAAVTDQTLVADWVFSEDKTLGPRVGGGIFTYTRTDSMWDLDENGVMQSAAANTPLYHGTYGISLWGASTGHALHNRDFTNAAWVKDGVTVQQDAVGLDSVSSAASTITASTAGGQVTQALTLATAASVFNPYVKRKTGTGTVEITIDGTTWIAVTGEINSSTYTRVSAGGTLNNPTVGFRLGTSGDEIEVDVAGMEQNGEIISTPPIVTGASAVTRSQPTCSLGGVSFINSSAGAVYARGMRPSSATQNGSVFVALSENGTYTHCRLYSSGVTGFFRGETPTLEFLINPGVSEVSGTVYERVGMWAPNDFEHRYINQDMQDVDTAGNVWSAGQLNSVVLASSNFPPINGYVAAVRVWNIRKPSGFNGDF